MLLIYIEVFDNISYRFGEAIFPTQYYILHRTATVVRVSRQGIQEEVALRTAFGNREFVCRILQDRELTGRAALLSISELPLPAPYVRNEGLRHSDALFLSEGDLW